MKKKIMILGAGEFQVPIIEKAVELGHEVIVVSPKGDYPGLSFSDNVIFEDVTNKDAILKHAIKEKIDGITTNQTDLPVRTMSYVASKLNLPGIDYETACLFTDKYLMRNKCKELGLNTIRYEIAEKIEEIHDFFDKINKPVIVKPIDSQGSRGIRVIRSKSEAADALCYALSYSRVKKVIVEEFITGKEYVVEGVVYEGFFTNLVVGDSHYFQSMSTFSPNCRIFPSNKKQEEVEKYHELMINGFGINTGLIHSEFIVDYEGNVYLIETAARGGGVNISSKIVKACTGFDSDLFMIDMALGNIPKLPDNGGKYFSSACYIAFYLPEGEVKSIGDLDSLKRHHSFLYSNIDSIFLGKKINESKDKSSRYYILLKADNDQDLLQSIEEVKREVGVKVQTKNGLMGPIWE